MTKTKNIILLCLIVVASLSYKLSIKTDEAPIFKNGMMPSVTKDAQDAIHIVFAKGNKLEYITSVDDGASFSSPVLVDTINGLLGVAGRGPKMISKQHTLIVLAVEKSGNIYAYTKEEKSKWIKRGKVNDLPDVCKEGFLSVSAKKDSLYAIWLDL